jgi:hypothetical protein
MTETAKDLSLSIRFDENCSRTVARDDLAAFVGRLTGVIRESTNDFVLMASRQAQVHIILDCAREQDGQLISCHPSPDAINCVRLLLKGEARNPETERDCQLLAFKIGKHLRWRLHDDTEVNAWLALDELVPVTITEDRPWWRFWR